MKKVAPILVGFMIISMIVPQAFSDSVENCKLGGCTPEQLEAYKDIPLAISTDKSSYNAGDKITIHGVLQDTINVGYQVGLLVQSPIGNVVSIAQISPDADNKFSTTIQTGEGGLWKKSGTYNIEARYNNMKADAQFEFDSGIVEETARIVTSEVTIEDEETIKVVVNGEIFSIKYSIENGTITAAYIDPENRSVIILIDALDDGVLTVTLPNSLITTDEYGFFILIDGEEANNYDESISGDGTTLIIPFSSSTDEIEIIGTWVVPEFGAIAGLVLALAIISIIVLSAKTKLNVIPKI